MSETDLSTFDNSDYRPGSIIARAIWYLTNLLFIHNKWFPFMGFKRFILRLFGSKVGKGVVIKPGVNIKYPWKLKIGDHTWIGEDVWIDNLGQVDIAAHCCVSQGAQLLCGNHNYKKSTFDLIVGDIKLEKGVWIGAKSIVTGGVTVHSHAVLSVNSVASQDLDAYSIYVGIPAAKVRERKIQSE
jgi:putative colanic acid biosynthesis acetyltransferase WcaF